MVQLWSSGCSHLISEGARVIPCLNGARVVPPSGRRVRHRQEHNDLCFISHLSITPSRSKTPDRPRACPCFSRSSGERVIGRSVAPLLCQGAGGPRRMLRRVLRHQAVVLRCKARQMQQAHKDHLLLSLCGWCIRRPPSGTRSSCLEMLYPDRTGCGYRIYGPGRWPRHCGSRSRPAPGSG